MLTAGRSKPATNVHGLEGVRGTTRCRHRACRRPVDDHALGTLACPNDSGKTLWLHVIHKGASQSFLQDEIRWGEKLLKTLRNGSDPRTLHDLMRRPEANRVQRKFQHMATIIEAREKLQDRFGREKP